MSTRIVLVKLMALVEKRIKKNDYIVEIELNRDRLWYVDNLCTLNDNEIELLVKYL